MRKRRPKQRLLTPDPRFNSPLVTRFVNNLMKDGKKSVAFKIFYDAMDIVEEKKEDKEVTVLEFWEKALENVTPQVEVASRKVGGSTFQIPRPVRSGRKVALAIRWMLQFSRAKNGKVMAQCLAEEILSAYKSEGASFKKKEDAHKMAEANKAFSHLKF